MTALPFPSSGNGPGSAIGYTIIAGIVYGMTDRTGERKASPGGARGPAAEEEAEVRLPDPVAMSRAMTDIAERSQRLVTDFLARRDGASATVDPLNIGGAFFEMTARMMADPSRVMQAQMALWHDYVHAVAAHDASLPSAARRNP